MGTRDMSRSMKTYIFYQILVMFHSSSFQFLPYLAAIFLCMNSGMLQLANQRPEEAAQGLQVASQRLQVAVKTSKGAAQTSKGATQTSGTSGTTKQSLRAIQRSQGKI